MGLEMAVVVDLATAPPGMLELVAAIADDRLEEKVLTVVEIEGIVADEVEFNIAVVLTAKPDGLDPIPMAEERMSPRKVMKT